MKRGLFDFLEYFEKNWLLENSCWYEGTAPGLPATNNGVQATNAVIKKFI